jgi:hypothetical protein
VSRDGGVVHADLSAVEESEWEHVLRAVDPEMTVQPVPQLVTHAGTSPLDGWRQVLVDSLPSTVAAMNVKARVVHTEGAGGAPP